MMRKYWSLIVFLIISLPLCAQDRTVEVRPYADLRPFHLGIVIGTHLQDLEFNNVGPHLVELDDGSSVMRTITCDQDKWDIGFNVGVLGELRINDQFSFRVSPQLYFGTRNITFRNYSVIDPEGYYTTEKQQLKSVYVAAPMDIIFNAKRYGNMKPYMMAGLNPMINLSAKGGDNIVALKRYDAMIEVGIGCDFYLPYFKLRPELKFCYSLLNVLDTKHVDELKDLNLKGYAQSVDKAHSKFVVLSFYFD